MRRRTIAAAFGLLLVHQPASAANTNMLGIGLMSCTEALPLLDDRATRLAFVAWAGGFMSGANAGLVVRDRRYRDLANLNLDLIVGELKAYCSAYPIGTVAHAVEAFWLGRPVRTFSP